MHDATEDEDANDPYRVAPGVRISPAALAEACRVLDREAARLLAERMATTRQEDEP